MDVESLAGSELAGFRLTQLRGAGGMAAVYEGENLLDNTIRRAIKVVRPELAARPEFVKRFAEEARVLERLSHPNIVKFYGVRREGGWLVMELELLEGQTLAAHVLARPNGLDVADALRWLADAATGVAAAHNKGVVHRDLKPENLFVTTDDTVKVLDFGIARSLDEADRATQATVAGRVPGTPAYMAPEVCEGGVPSAQADVYALGLTLVEALLGRHPFDKAGQRLSSVQLMFAQVHQPIAPPSSTRSDISPAVDAVVVRAVEKAPTLRFATAQAFSDALRGLTAGSAAGARAGKGATELHLPTFQSQRQRSQPRVVSASSARPRALHPRLVALASTGVATTVVIGALWWWSLPEPVAGPPEPLDNPFVQVAANTSGREQFLGISNPGSGALGFTPARRIRPPSVPYELQQHEVSWSELDPFLAARPASAFPLPPGVPTDPEARRTLPASGVPWQVARSYCQSLGGDLPTEEQWEWAARGPTLNAHPWGGQPLDRTSVMAFAGPTGVLQPVTASPQDRTPGTVASQLHDLAGNAREWTADLYRDNRTVEEACAGRAADCRQKYEAFVQSGGSTWRAVRGLPLHDPMPTIGLPRESAAWREASCGTGSCLESTLDRRRDIGVRCARPVKE